MKAITGEGIGGFPPNHCAKAAQTPPLCLCCLWHKVPLSIPPQWGRRVPGPPPSEWMPTCGHRAVQGAFMGMAFLPGQHYPRVYPVFLSMILCLLFQPSRRDNNALGWCHTMKPVLLPSSEVQLLATWSFPFLLSLAAEQAQPAASPPAKKDEWKCLIA